MKCLIMPLLGSWKSRTGSSTHHTLWGLFMSITVWTSGWETPVPVVQLPEKDIFLKPPHLADESSFVDKGSLSHPHVLLQSLKPHSMGHIFTFSD